MANITIVDIKDIKPLHQNAGRSGDVTAWELPVKTGVPSISIDFDYVTFSKGYGTPRHKHTFDQIRYVVDGVFQSDVGDIKAGEVGYYPEGVSYGPQMQDEPVTVLFMQFPGPSKIPYVTHSELSVARQQLVEEGGTFKDGVYTKVSADGSKVNKDSHGACFERATGMPLKIPAGRLAAPVFMRPQAYHWTPDRRIPGLQHKHLGTFGECRTSVSFMKLEAGAKLPAHLVEDAETLYVTEGSITYKGKKWLGGTTPDRGTHIYMPPGAKVEDIATEEGATLFRIVLPMVAEWAQADTDRTAA